MINLEELYVLAPEQRDLLLRMGLARRVGPFVIGDRERIAAELARQLVDDLEAIGFRVILGWDRRAE